MNDEVKSGIVKLYDGYGKSQPLKLTLSVDSLLLQKEEWISVPLEEEDEAFLSLIREVNVVRDGNTRLGLCVKGGAEHHLPVLISRLIKDQAADRCGELLVGDAVLKVNGVSVESYTHDEVVQAMKNTEGDIVQLTVRHFRPASHFLNKNNQLRDLALGEENDGNMPSLPSVESRWTAVVSIPLLYARLSRFYPGTDKLRTNSFEVCSCDGTSTGALHCEDNRSLAEWIQAITSNINGLLSQMIQMTNRLLVPEEHIALMCWVHRRVSPAVHFQAWKPVFLCLKGADIFLFDIPPMHATDWTQCASKFKIYECMFKILKEEELLDDRQHCCTVQTGSREKFVLSVESRADMLQIERAWFKTNSLTVHRLKNVTFGCTWRGRLSGLTLDLGNGFSLVDHNTKSFVWIYRFSQLKGSSDDGKTHLKLLFQNEANRSTETREIECSDLQTLMFCIHAFLSAKISSVDPAFLTNY
ncbi:gamma-1-syntrophin-like [Gigantopelta aegis]|uniref:gamma-1-syntrophin-like n=1 Tax=Gigantopelta aegis TaxID=1735272 RepID=UPI001B88D0D5|nr:gamma-1-syntrophin-like [Gigantopelta aegis]